MDVELLVFSEDSVFPPVSTQPLNLQLVGIFPHRTAAPEGKLLTIRSECFFFYISF